MHALPQLALEWGIEPDYIDARGLPRRVDEETLRQVVEIVSRGQRPPQRRWLPPFVVIRRGREPVLALGDHAPSASFDWAVFSGETKIASGTARGNQWRLPNDLPIGAFELEIRGKGPGEGGVERTNLLVAPERAYGGQAFAGGRRVWGLAVQLYGVRSRRNWGHGDFTDLLGLLDLSADLGAAGIGLNPLHALFPEEPERASPYSPNSRLFLNPLYIDVEAVPEFPGIAAAGLAGEVPRLRETELVDYARVAAAKSAGLRLAFRQFQQHGSRERREDFAAFRQERGRALAHFASFEVLCRRFGRKWAEWPEPWRRPDAAALDELRESAQGDVEFHEFVQWLADRQLRACRDKAQSLGLSLGLYLDVAVGVDPNGADAWSEQATMLTDVSVGAPPDQLNTAGQNWGLAAFNPRALEQRGFEAFRRMLQGAMRYAGAIRIDHVLGLNRLYLIPKGARAGSYVRFPLEALFAVVAQESIAQHCIVIGEDLGTVPEHFRERLADWGVWSYRVLLFERGENGSFRRPADYSENALVTFSTHDLPTFAGWVIGRDLLEKRGLGIDPGETEAERAEAQAGLRAALARQRKKKGAALDFPAVANYLAAAPCRLLMIAMEDPLGVLDQPNMPGTIDEHPNWRRRLPVGLEELHGHAALRALSRALRRAGRAMDHPKPPRGPKR